MVKQRQNGRNRPPTQLVLLQQYGACGKLRTMEKEIKDGCWASPKALLRYDVVRYLEEAVRSGLPLRRALCAGSEREWYGRYFGVSTIETWYYQYRQKGLAALEDNPRKDKGQTRALAPATMEAFLNLRRENPQLHITSLLRRMQQQELLETGSVSLSTLYRLVAREGLDRRSIQTNPQGPTKAYEFAWANEFWLTDAMHGPAVPLVVGGKPMRTHLLAIMDDCSRLCPHGQYYHTEQLECFLDVLRHALERRGIPNKLYTDNGKIFISEHLRIICANFGIHISHAKPYAAWSKGKIERFFATVQGDFEQRLVFEPAKSLTELNQRFWQWLEVEYHQREHGSLEGQSPQKRFAERSKGLRTITAGMDVAALFLKRVKRRVRRDATISIGGVMWEVPVALMGREVEVHYDPFRWQRMDIFLEGQQVGAAQRCNKQINAHSFNNKEQHESR